MPGPVKPLAAASWLTVSVTPGKVYVSAAYPPIWLMAGIFAGTTRVVLSQACVISMLKSCANPTYGSNSGLVFENSTATFNEQVWEPS